MATISINGWQGVMRIRLKGINSKRKKLADGSFKTYYWLGKGGPPLRGEPGSQEFSASYNEDQPPVTREQMHSLCHKLSLPLLQCER
jgi:hypothetical protein